MLIGLGTVCHPFETTDTVSGLKGVPHCPQANQIVKKLQNCYIFVRHGHHSFCADWNQESGIFDQLGRIILIMNSNFKTYNKINSRNLYYCNCI